MQEPGLLIQRPLSQSCCPQPVAPVAQHLKLDHSVEYSPVSTGGILVECLPKASLVLLWSTVSGLCPVSLAPLRSAVGDVADSPPACIFRPAIMKSLHLLPVVPREAWLIPRPPITPPSAPPAVPKVLISLTLVVCITMMLCRDRCNSPWLHSHLYRAHTRRRCFRRPRVFVISRRAGFGEEAEV